ncbi:MAG: hypothetical protein J5742_00315 [Alphaproteobacteria bacterium]|nr:hypothetical protein [Alphaproteobacteria bacterium]
MKMYLPGFVFATMLVASMPAIGATGYGMSGNSNNMNYAQYETRSTTRTYSNTGNYGAYNNSNYGTRYYNNQGANRNQMYRGYNGASSTRTVTTNNRQTVRRSMKRKYYLAHPFFQPTEGKFGSITDLAYNTASYNFDITPASGVTMSDTSAKWDMKQYAVKEDFSFGITDRFGLLLMGRYDTTKYKFDWSTAPDDKMDDHGFNIYGAGAQWRFVDNEKWIGTLSAYYERQQDIANEFVLDLKAGYKVSKSTIYGLARGWLVNFDEEMYGNGVVGSNESGYTESIFLEYDGDAERTFFFEAGLGVFSVLDEDWTLNVEALVGNYDWHNQASIKGAIGWQPNDWFALNLYVKTSFFDSADGKNLDFYGTESGIWKYMGEAKLDKYREMSVGGQIIFYF